MTDDRVRTKAARRAPVRPAIWLLASLAALGPFSVSLYLPGLPALTKAFGATAAQGDLTMTVYLAGFAVAQLVYGPLSDRYGRRPTIIAGLIIYIAASGVAASATSIPILLAARFAQAAGSCAGTAMSRAIVRDSASGSEIARLLATIAAVLTLSPAIGPAVGGFVATWFGWRACFVVLTSLGAALLTVVIWRLPETNEPVVSARLSAAAIARGYIAMVRDSAFLSAVLCGGFISAAAFVYNVGSPFVFISILGLGPSEYGLLGLITGAGYFGGTWITRRRAARATTQRLTLEGSFWCLAGAAGLLASATVGPLAVWSVVTSMLLFAVGLGLLLPTTAAAALARYPRAAGAAAAMVGCAQMGCGVAGTAALSALNPATAVPMAGLVAALTVLTASTAIFAAWHNRDH